MTSYRFNTTAKTCISVAALVAGSLAFSAPAAAQEGPFEGFYAGVNAGVVWSDSTAVARIASTSTTPIVTPPIAGGSVTAINSSAELGGKHATGFTGGLEAGYNYVSNHNGLLLGIETDIDIYDMTGNGTATAQAGGATYTLAQEVKTDWMWTLRPKIGYAGDTFEAYATAGLAMTNAKYHGSLTDSATPGDNITVDEDHSKTGWMIGAGAGYALGKNIAIKGEYLFADFGKADVSGTSTNGYYTFSAEEHLKSHLFRAGLDYKF